MTSPHLASILSSKRYISLENRKSGLEIPNLRPYY